MSSRNKLTGSEKEYLRDLDYLSHILDKKSDYKIKKFAGKLKDMACLLIGCTREQLEDREFKDKELGEQWRFYSCEGYYDGSKYKEIFSDIIDAEEFCNNYSNSSYETLIHTPRTLMQLLGTECGRQIIHPNIWENALFADYNDNDVNPIKVRQGRLTALQAFDLGQSNKPNWIITDVRFPNEAQAIKDRGGIVIRVERKPFNRAGGMEGNKQFSEQIKEDTHLSETALDDYDFDYVIENDGSIKDLVEKVKKLNIISIID